MSSDTADIGLRGNEQQQKKKKNGKKQEKKALCAISAWRRFIAPAVARAFHELAQPVTLFPCVSPSLCRTLGAPGLFLFFFFKFFVAVRFF